MAAKRKVKGKSKDLPREELDVEEILEDISRRIEEREEEFQKVAEKVVKSFVEDLPSVEKEKLTQGLKAAQELTALLNKWKGRGKDPLTKWVEKGVKA